MHRLTPRISKIAVTLMVWMATGCGGGQTGVFNPPPSPTSPPGIIKGNVTTLAGGNGTTDKDGQGKSAAFVLPYGITYDSADGNFYVVEFFGRTVRRVSPSGLVGTLAGSGIQGSCGGTGTAALLEGPWDIRFVANQFYVADDGSAVCTVDPSTGAVADIAGQDAVPGTNDGTGTAARFSCPSSVAYVPAQNTLFITDGDAIRTLDLSTLQVVTRAGSINAPGHADGLGLAASFNEPEGITFDAASNTLYIADSKNNEIRAMNATTYAVTTPAGNLSAGFANGTGTAAQFNTLWGVTYNPADGLIYIADSGNNAIRALNPSTLAVVTIAGSGAAGAADGFGGAATFNFPAYIAFGPGGNYLLVTDAGFGLIREVQ